jgi:hypothetical protein
MSSPSTVHVAAAASATASATATHTPQPADPWDAPYFGGPVFLAYAPGLVAAPVAVSSPAQSAAPQAVPGVQPPSSSAAPTAVRPALGLDAWDAPYFGGPVFFRYPTYPVTVHGFSPMAAAPPIAAPAAPERAPAPVVSPRRRGLLARLFGVR